ncbi:hypothetical protein KP509_01G118900 [Ceratopteris richardii]|nr:hypothetical protein KP509_01G118900 [Ceratopteris richardii]
MPMLCLSSKCRQKCGSLDIIYPFYLKGTPSVNGHPNCGLRGYELECREDKTFILIGSEQRYQVLELGSGVLRIDPLFSNNCSVNNLMTFQLSSTAYRLCSDNMLQLHNCKRGCQNYSIPLPKNYLLSPSLQCQDARPSCCESLQNSLFNNSPDFRLHDFTGGYQNLQNYSIYYECSRFTSWTYATNRSLSIYLYYGLKLEWFIKGHCSCSLHARCKPSYGGHTCMCNANFIGDGYANGTGCDPEFEREQENHSRVTANLTAILASGIVGAACILGIAMIIGAVLFRRRKDRFCSRRAFQWGGSRRENIRSLEILLSGLEPFTYKQLHKATKGFASSEKLGAGGSGTVYVANLEDGRRVAVKRLHNSGTQVAYQHILNELSVLSAAKHKNLVMLFGCSLDSVEPLLVFEYVSNGTLAEHLQRGEEGLDWHTRLNIVTQAADALSYLHTLHAPILHRDVKSWNILVDDDLNAKVADFGLSCLGPSASSDCSHLSTIPQGTPGYVDPEYHQNFHLSDKSDVYSFGVVLIEIITALKPIDFSREKKEVNLATLAVIKICGGTLEDIIDPFLQAQGNNDVITMVHKVSELAFRCLAYDKDARPSMTEVLKELILIRESTTSIKDDSTSINNSNYLLGRIQSS